MLTCVTSCHKVLIDFAEVAVVSAKAVLRCTSWSYMMFQTG